MIKPNIFLIGVQKAGTTSLYHYLRKHPNIFGPEIKDYNNSHPFFTDENYFRNNQKEFEKLFSENDSIQNVITSEVEFIEHKEAMLRIKEYCPEAKIIVSLRNPVERLKSMYKYYNQIGSNPENLSFEDALKLKPELYLKRSLYSEKIKNLYDVFDSHQIKIIYFEDIIGSNFDSVIEELYEFIGVEKKENPFIHENKTRKVKYDFVDRIMKLGKDSKVRTFLVHKVIDRFFNANKRYELKSKIREWNLKDHSKGSNAQKNDLVPNSISKLIKEDTIALGEFLKADLVSFWNLK